MHEPVIRVENVGKRFRLRSPGARTLKSAVLEGLRPAARKREFWALRGVSFTVARGETLGIIGANGAGKSTLLAVLAGTKMPTEGRLQTNGSISALLELGSGFHPDLTGRENVCLNGVIMGLSRRQMEARMDAIIAFAGLEAFIDQPVKHYSSGMYVRLGFAVAVEVDPDVLLIDEVLAVGDADFQRKCLARMETFREQGKTMLIISHDLATIQSVSDRILFLEAGRVVGVGAPDRMVDRYQSRMLRQTAGTLEREWGTGEVRIVDVVFRNANGGTSERFAWGESVDIAITYEAGHPVEQPVFGFAVCDDQGRLIYGNNTQAEGMRIERIRGRGRLRLRIKALNMSSGTYLFSFSVHSWDHRVQYHRLDHAFAVGVESERRFEGVCYMPVDWRFDA